MTLSGDRNARPLPAFCQRVLIYVTQVPTYKNTETEALKSWADGGCPSCDTGHVPYRKQQSQTWLEDTCIIITSNILWEKVTFYFTSL